MSVEISKSRLLRLRKNIREVRRMQERNGRSIAAMLKEMLGICNRVLARLP